MINNFVSLPDGTKLPKLGQGTWLLGKNPNFKASEIYTLQAGIDMGCNLIDTAEMYENEDLVGQAIKDFRNNVYIVSKVHPMNASLNGTRLACERSLKLLKTDHIDLYLLHWKGRFPFIETIKAFEILKKEGKILNWGVSNIDVPDMNKIAGLPSGDKCAVNQVLYNIEQRGIEFDLIDWQSDNKMPIMAYSPIGEGRLLSNQVLIEIANKYGVSSSAIALAFVLRHNNVLAIPKTSNIKHLQQNMKSLEIVLDDDDLNKINSAFPPPIAKIPLAGW